MVYFRGQGSAFALLGFSCHCLEIGLSYNVIIMGIAPSPVKFAAVCLPPRKRNPEIKPELPRDATSHTF